MIPIQCICDRLANVHSPCVLIILMFLNLTSFNVIINISRNKFFEWSTQCEIKLVIKLKSVRESNAINKSNLNTSISIIDTVTQNLGKNFISNSWTNRTHCIIVGQYECVDPAF